MALPPTVFSDYRQTYNCYDIQRRHNFVGPGSYKRLDLQTNLEGSPLVASTLGEGEGGLGTPKRFTVRASISTPKTNDLEYYADFSKQIQRVTTGSDAYTIRCSYNFGLSLRWDLLKLFRPGPVLTTLLKSARGLSCWTPQKFTPNRPADPAGHKHTIVKSTQNG